MRAELAKVVGDKVTSKPLNTALAEALAAGKLLKKGTLLALSKTVEIRDPRIRDHAVPVHLES